MSGRPSLARLLQKALFPKLLAALLFICLFISSAVLYFAKDQVADTQRSHIENLRADIDYSLRDTLLLMESIAANDLLTNSLIDLEQRDTYLPLFFRTLRLTRSNTDSLGLFDFSGEPIITNHWDNHVPESLSTHWQKPTLEQGRRFWEITENGIILAVPVFIGSSAEGALVLYIKNLNELIYNRDTRSTQLIVNEQNRVVYSSSPTLLAPGTTFNKTDYEHWVSYTKSWQGLNVISMSSVASAYQSVLWLIPVVIICIVATILVGLYAVNRSAAMTASTLQSLYESILVSMERKTAARSVAPDNEAMELAVIREAFDNLTSNLMAITLSNRQFSNVIDSLEEMLIVMNNDGNIIMANHRYDAVLKDHELDQKALENICQRLKIEQAPVDMHYKNANGQSLVLKWTLLPFYNEARDVIGSILVANDVTSQRKLEDRIHLVTQAMENATVSIAIAQITGQSSEIVYSNSHFSALSGFEKPHITGNSLLMLCGENTEKDKIAAIAHAIDTGESIDTTMLFYKKNGVSFYARTVLTPVQLKGKVTHYAIFIQDVTEQEQTREYLEDARYRAEESARMKSSFLASMSHEVRTPLHGISGTLQLLEDSQLDTRQSQYLNLAMQSMNNLQHIVDDILDFSKIEAGQLNIEHTHFNLALLLDSICEQYQANCQAKGIRLIMTKVLQDHEQVIGDPVRLRQILGNLLSNAVKFTSHGEVAMTIRLQSQPGGLQLFGEVSDSGIGIAGDKIQHIFEVFTQEDSTTTRRFGGTGLGLAITRQLCQLCGGDIHVSSVKGKGSSFSFVIMLQEATDHKAPEQITRPAPQTPNDLPPAKILLVEDNEINQLIAKENLASHKVITAVNGKQAISALNQIKAQFDLILMDCHMPEMDGFEATQRIRNGEAGERYLNVPIIALTANAMKGDRETCVAAGMDDYIAKPFTQEELARVIGEWAQTSTSSY
ncbi:ATP-binding protein [Salinimonas lutimaris]|uniref:ATP-binding protein n=1 Tax=Salinimonas lutimaris TaxID=914153 RepID=UPI0010C0A431|nr:ATP-binding protein [Salinimonas lutimaris]